MTDESHVALQIYAFRDTSRVSPSLAGDLLHPFVSCVRAPMKVL